MIDIVERLRQRKTEYKYMAGFGGAIMMETGESRQYPINPDGPEAADLIEKLRKQIRDLENNS